MSTAGKVKLDYAMMAKDEGARVLAVFEEFARQIALELFNASGAVQELRQAVRW